MAEKQAEVSRREDTGVTLRETPSPAGSPFRLLDRFADEMNRLFDEFGFGRGWPAPRFTNGGWHARAGEEWCPDVEMLQRKDEIVIRADLPGLKKEHLKVDITDIAVTIHGERRREREERREGMIRAERCYGGFCRVLTLPEGAMTDQAKATFRDGVLEITMPAAPESPTHGRRLEITEDTTQRR